MPAAAQIADSAAGVVADIPANYTESLAGDYKLPDPLMMANGQKVKDAKTWFGKRRPEMVRLFEENQFGRAPGKPERMHFEVFDKASAALDGKAMRRQVTIYFTGDKQGPKMDLLMYLPNNTRKTELPSAAVARMFLPILGAWTAPFAPPAGAAKPVPVLLNVSFSANSSTVADPGIRAGEVWNAREKKRQPATAGRWFGRLNVAKFLDAGFGVATFYYGDVDPDFLGGIPDGIRAAYLKPGATEPEAGEWGAVAAWAWGASRALDYLETDEGVDAKRVAITGVSRLGKTVLWAGARDTRFAMVIASCSGEGGAALSRRNYGETIAHLVAPGRYPYQFAANYGKYGKQVDQFPVDAHMLVSLIAPRPLLLQTGTTDKWSDPYGEFLAAAAAEPVYRLLGKKEQLPEKMPPPGSPLLNPLGFLIHEGGHGTIPADWDVFVEFMKKYL